MKNSILRTLPSTLYQKIQQLIFNHVRRRYRSELEKNSQRDNCQIQHSIDRLLGNDNNVSANDFLSINDKILSIESTDQKIVDCVLGKDTEVEADEIIGVTNKEAIECLEIILFRKIIYQSHSNGFASLIVITIIFSIILCLKKYRRNWSSTSTLTLIIRDVLQLSLYMFVMGIEYEFNSII